MWCCLRVCAQLSGSKQSVSIKGETIFAFNIFLLKKFTLATCKFNFQDDIPSIPFDNSKDHYVLVFDLTSMQDATENCHYPEFVGELLRLELNFNFSPEHVTELIVLEARMSSVAVDKFGVVGKIFKKDNVSLQQIFNRIPLFKYRYCGSFMKPDLRAERQRLR